MSEVVEICPTCDIGADGGKHNPASETCVERGPSDDGSVELLSSGMATEPPPKDSSITIYTGGKALVTLKTDGTLEFGEDYDPDEAARIFWQSVADGNPLLGENTRLRAALVEAVELLGDRAEEETVGPGVIGAMVVMTNALGK